MPDNTISNITDQNSPQTTTEQLNEAAETARRLWAAAREAAKQTDPRQIPEPKAPKKPVESMPATLPDKRPLRPYSHVKGLLEPQLTPVMVSGLSAYSVGYMNLGEKSLGFKASLYAGSAILTGLGAYQGFRDIDNFNRADSPGRRALFGTALAVDAGIVSAGVMSLTKFGPRWLAPTLMLGSLSTRAMLDFAEISTRKFD